MVNLVKIMECNVCLKEKYKLKVFKNCLFIKWLNLFLFLIYNLEFLDFLVWFFEIDLKWFFFYKNVK